MLTHPAIPPAISTVSSAATLVFYSTTWPSLSTSPAKNIRTFSVQSHCIACMFLYGVLPQIWMCGWKHETPLADP